MPAEATVRVGPAVTIPTVLRSLGADPDEVLAEAGLDPAVFDNPENLISFEARSRLLNRCVARTGCQHFGLLVCQRNGLRSLGLLGLLLKYSPDVGTALRSLVRSMHLQVRGSLIRLDVHRESALLVYAVYHPDAQAVEQAGDGALATMFNILRELCGPEWKPDEVFFAHRRPRDVKPFREFFHAPLSFDAEQYALAFPAKWLLHRVHAADPDLHHLLQDQIDALEARHYDDFPEQVRRVLHTGLPAHHANADQVAALFSMHRRTLHRRLQAFGTSFQKLADEARHEIARQMLEDSRLAVSQVAAALDYADASAFTRAFRRWSGTTPARWRTLRNHAA